ncbi:DUF2059 domain-containing protein [Thermomonas sp.]|uniref:DUF2059 domain-containing protein n=1 Tax=Thermomonas sp. TaxID=1971895 RepID=UPI0035B3EFC4
MRRFVLSLALLCTLTPAVAAQPQAVPAQATMQAASDADLDRLLKAMDMQSMMAGMMQQMVDAQGNLVAQSFAKDMTEADRARMQAVLDKTHVILQKHMAWSALEPVVRKVYAQVFSKQEVLAMTAFYSSPEGTSILKKSPQAMALTMQEIQPIALAAMAEVKTMVEQETRADTRTPPPASPGAKP